MTEALGSVAPGRPLREGLDRILQANMGALIVVGDGPEVLAICSGGFLLDAEFSPQRLSELAKMDGAIILASDASRIARANVHLVPNPNVPTSETGTRHRTAERVARSVDVPVISVSEDMSIIAVYRHDTKHPLEPVPRLVTRANQALQTLERYKTRLDAVSGALSALEVEDLVTVRDVVTVLQRAEMVGRIAEEIDGYIVELGTDGRLVLLQLEELMGGVADDRRLVIKDYFQDRPRWRLEKALEALSSLTTEDLLDLKSVVGVLHLPTDANELEAGVQPRGYRLLSKIPRLPDAIIENIVERFGSLQKILRAGTDELDDVEGVGEVRARAIKEGLSRLPRRRSSTATPDRRPPPLRPPAGGGRRVHRQAWATGYRARAASLVASTTR
jgi:diadenylate cyclase